MDTTTYMLKYEADGELAARLTFDREDNYYFNGRFSDVDMDPMLTNDDMAMEMIMFAIVDGDADYLDLRMLENGEWTWGSIADSEGKESVLKILMRVIEC